MKDSKGSVVVLLLVFFGLAASATAFYFYQKSQSPNLSTSITTSNPETSNKSEPTTPPTPADETANWKTYTNRSFGYKLDYPANWSPREITKVDPQQSQNEYLGNDKLQGVVFEQKNDLYPCLVSVYDSKGISLEAWIENYKSKITTASGTTRVRSVKDAILETLPAKIVSIFNFISEGISTVTLHQGKIYLLSYENLQDNSNFTPTQQQTGGKCVEILATFKFLN